MTKLPIIIMGCNLYIESDENELEMAGMVTAAIEDLYKKDSLCQEDSLHLRAKKVLEGQYAT